MGLFNKDTIDLKKKLGDSYSSVLLLIAMYENKSTNPQGLQWKEAGKILKKLEKGKGLTLDEAKKVGRLLEFYIESALLIGSCGDPAFYDKICEAKEKLKDL